MSTDLKLFKAHINKKIQSGGFSGSLLSKLAGPLTKIAVPLAKNVLAPLGITAAASAIDTRIQKKYMVLEQQLFKYATRNSRCYFIKKFIIRKRNCKSRFWKAIGFLMKPHPLTNFEI